MFPGIIIHDSSSLLSRQKGRRKTTGGNVDTQKNRQGGERTDRDAGGRHDCSRGSRQAGTGMNLPAIVFFFFFYENNNNNQQPAAAAMLQPATASGQI